MAKLSAALRRYWGLRPGELERPVTMLGAGRRMGEPRSGPHGRGWLAPHRVRRSERAQAR